MKDETKSVMISPIIDSFASLASFAVMLLTWFQA